MTGMDEKLRLASLTAFYFGTRVAADPTSPEAITNVSKRAYRDLSRTLHGIGTHPAKTTLLESAHASLHAFVTDLEEVKTREEFDALHDTWCEDRICFFREHPHPDREAFVFTYGQAQKWINMTLKYLAVLGHPTVADVTRTSTSPSTQSSTRKLNTPPPASPCPAHPEAQHGRGSPVSSAGIINSHFARLSPPTAMACLPHWTGRRRRGSSAQPPRPSRSR